MTDELRAKFEAWARNNGYRMFSIVPRDDMYKKSRQGCYEDFMVEDAWRAWQAAHASRDAEVAKLQSIIDGQQDTIDALKRKLALAKESTK